LQSLFHLVTFLAFNALEYFEQQIAFERLLKKHLEHVALGGVFEVFGTFYGYESIEILAFLQRIRKVDEQRLVAIIRHFNVYHLEVVLAGYREFDQPFLVDVDVVAVVGDLERRIFYITPDTVYYKLNSVASLADLSNLILSLLSFCWAEMICCADSKSSSSAVLSAIEILVIFAVGLDVVGRYNEILFDGLKCKVKLR
jgi:hypothetical protein